MTKLTSMVFIAALTAALPASAQERDNRAREAARARGGSPRAERAPEQRRDTAQPRGDERRREQPRAEAPRAEAPRAEVPRAPAPRQDAPRAEAPRGQAPRADYRGGESGHVVGQAAPRGDAYRRNDGYRREDDRARYNGPNGYDRGHDDAARGQALRRFDYERRYSNGRYYYAPRYVPGLYYRPYVFRPRLSIGFGIFAGFPVPYSYRYAAPIYVYGYRAPQSAVVIEPGSGYYGGVALEMSPADADVFVDGNYAGKVEDFDGTYQPLTVVAGRHRIEVQAPGYAPLVFEVDVLGGQVIPYRGDLRPY